MKTPHILYHFSYRPSNMVLKSKSFTDKAVIEFFGFVGYGEFKNPRFPEGIQGKLFRGFRRKVSKFPSLLCFKINTDMRKFNWKNWKAPDTEPAQEDSEGLNEIDIGSILDQDTSPKGTGQEKKAPELAAEDSGAGAKCVGISFFPASRTCPLKGPAKGFGRGVGNRRKICH